LVPVGDKGSQCGVVPGVGVDDQDGTAIQPWAQVGQRSRGAERHRFLHREVHPSDEVTLELLPAVVDVDRNGVASDHGGDPGNRQIDQGSTGHRAQRLGSQPAEGT
jgi:hypothetical protein